MLTFRNLILTNGYFVEFIFKKKKPPSSPKSSFNSDKLQNALIPEDFAEKNEEL
jgi:hypothetical protein